MAGTITVGLAFTMTLSKGVNEQHSVEKKTVGLVLSGRWVGMMAEKWKKGTKKRREKGGGKEELKDGIG